MKKPGRRPSKYRSRFWEALPQATQKPIGAILEDIDRTVKEGFQAIGRNDGSEVQIVSEAVAKLPAYMKGLGYYLAEAESLRNTLKDDYELLRAQKEKVLIRGGASVAVSEREVATDAEVVEAKDIFRKAEHNHKILKLQWDATEKQIDGFRSRLTTTRADLRSGE